VAGPRYPAEGGDPSEAPTPEDRPTRQVVLAPGGARPDRVEVTIAGDLGVALQDVTSPTHALDVRRDGDRRVRVSLSEAARPDRDLDVRFRVAGEAPAIAVLASPPDRGEGDEAERGHLSLALHPQLAVPDDEVMPRELVFVVDTSSSMHGRSLELAKAAMHAALEGLQPADTFRVLSFSDTTSALSEAALPATDENVARARRYVDRMQALGATEMVRGLRAALEPETEA